VAAKKSLTELESKFNIVTFIIILSSVLLVNEFFIKLSEI